MKGTDEERREKDGERKKDCYFVWFAHLFLLIISRRGKKKIGRREQILSSFILFLQVLRHTKNYRDGGERKIENIKKVRKRERTGRRKK